MIPPNPLTGGGSPTPLPNPPPGRPPALRASGRPAAAARPIVGTQHPPPPAISRSATGYTYSLSSAHSLIGEIDMAIRERANDKLFSSLKNNDGHLLYPLLPQKCNHHYSLRQQPHQYPIPTRTTQHSVTVILSNIIKCYKANILYL